MVRYTHQCSTGMVNRVGGQGDGTSTSTAHTNLGGGGGAAYLAFVW